MSDGASVPDQALVYDQAAARLAPSGFDPSRVMEDFYLSRYYEPKADRPADNVLAAIEYVNDLYLRPATTRNKDLASLAGWAARRLPPLWEKYVVERLGRDSDGSGEAGETAGLDPKGDSAGRKASPDLGIASQGKDRNGGEG